MCLGCRYGAKTLATIILFFSLKSFAIVSTLPAAFEATVGASLINSGVPEEEARNEAKEVSKWAFGDAETGRKGRFSSENEAVSLKKLLSERVVEGIDFTNPEGERGVIFNIAENGTEADKKFLEKVINNALHTKGSLVFKRKKRVQEILSFCGESEVSDCEYVIAPDWYSSLELFKYRSKRPVNKDGDYIYSNSPFGMYEGVYFNSVFDFRFEKKVYLDLGVGYRGGKEKISIYNESYYPCDKDNPICDDPDPHFIEDDSSFSNLLLSFNYTKSVEELPYENYKALLEEVRQNDFEREERFNSFNEETGDFKTDEEILKSIGSPDPFDISTLFNEKSDISLEKRYAYKYQYPVLKIREDNPLNKNIEDIKDTDTEIDIISTNSGITDKESADYSIEYSSLADIYTGVLRSYVRSGSSSSGGSSSSTPNLLEKFRSDSYFSSSDVSSTISSLGLKRPKLGDFSDGKIDKNKIPKPLPLQVDDEITVEEFTSDSIYNKYTNAGHYIDDKETKHFPIIPVHTGTDGRISSGSTASSGSSIGSGSSSTDNSGSTAAGGAVSNSASNSRANSKAETAVIDKVSPKEAEEDKSEFFLPTLEDISAKEILQPFFDLKASILSELHFSMPAGDCPRPSVELFGQNYSIEAHCEIFDGISSTISAFAVVLWLILAFRVIFSA